MREEKHKNGGRISVIYEKNTDIEMEKIVSKS